MQCFPPLQAQCLEAWLQLAHLELQGIFNVSAAKRSRARQLFETVAEVRAISKESFAVPSSFRLQ